MKFEIITLTEKKLVGKRVKMSFTRNLTFELWRSFMPRRKDIVNSASPYLYSIEVYGRSFFEDFSPAAEFEKWAAVEVTDFGAVPDEMETLSLPGGLYTVFTYKGAASGAALFIRDVLTVWLPQSGYMLDNRPHFSMMGASYKGEDPDSEEEIWIPVRHQVSPNM